MSALILITFFSVHTVSMESRARKLLHAAERGYPDRLQRVLGKDIVDLGDPETGDTALVS